MEQIVDIATDGRRLSALRGFMLVADAQGRSRGGCRWTTWPRVVIHAHGVTWSTNLACALAERGAPIVFCASNHAPGGRPACRWRATTPRTPSCAPSGPRRARSPNSSGAPWWWPRSRWQAAVLEAQGHSANAFDLLARPGALGRSPTTSRPRAARAATGPC